jgi:hypothetical protein
MATRMIMCWGAFSAAAADVQQGQVFKSFEAEAALNNK